MNVNNFKVVRNTCDCHPETCACNDWKIVFPDGTTLTTMYDKAEAVSYADCLNQGGDCK